MIKYKNTFIQNIYYMLSYAFTSLRQKEYEDIATEEFDNIHNLFAVILAKGIGWQLKQGLYREYLNQIEDMVTLRGKLIIPRTIKNSLAKKRVLSCEYDVLSENILLNQIIKTTVMLLVRHSEVSSEYKSVLKKEMLFFSNVETIKPNMIRWGNIRFHRNNNTYRMLIGLCQLILDGMLMTTDMGDYRLRQIIDSQRMERLYEKFILNYYRIEYRHQINANASYIPWSINQDDGLKELLPNMKSDIMLEKDHSVLIIDAKLKTHTMQKYYDVDKLHSANLYQIFTYVKNKESSFGEEAHTVSGMLLYAATDEVIQPDASCYMGDNKISVRTLDLNCDFATIKKQLNAIVEEHFEVSSNQT